MMVGIAPLRPHTISNAGPEGRWLLKRRSFETSFLKSMIGDLAAFSAILGVKTCITDPVIPQI
jgi:hypothetical protein